MNYFIISGKLLMITIWGLLIVNLFFPFPGQAALLFYILLGLMSVMHIIQLLIFYGAFSEKLKLTKADALQVFFFGVFKLWELKGRLAS
jgi:putative membrane protein